MTGTLDQASIGQRTAWMRILALSEPQDLASHAAGLTGTPHDILRPPETGLVMLRGRMGATGNAFNLGEATVTRCAVRLTSGQEGHAYILGRDAEHARLAALCDALLQDGEAADTVRDKVLLPLADKLQARRQINAGKAAATKVDFFTLVRGDD